MKKIALLVLLAALAFPARAADLAQDLSGGQIASFKNFAESGLVAENLAHLGAGALVGWAVDRGLRVLGVTNPLYLGVSDVFAAGAVTSVYEAWTHKPETEGNQHDLAGMIGAGLVVRVATW